MVSSTHLRIRFLLASSICTPNMQIRMLTQPSRSRRAETAHLFIASVTEQFSTDTVRAVLNYKFGEPPEAVPLK